jgi:hypothetical protein
MQRKNLALRARVLLACAGLAAVIGVTAAVPEAHAFGDTCHAPIRVRGDFTPTQRGAMASARAQWESAAARRHGQRFANWYYSGDREFECSWNQSGTRFRCFAIAMPCGKKR